jgi:hypothetical protein
VAYNTAIFIDAENVAGQHLKGVLNEIYKTAVASQIAVRRASNLTSSLMDHSARLKFLAQA